MSGGARVEAGDAGRSFGPIAEVTDATGFTQLEPDSLAPVDLIRVDPDGTTSVLAAGDLGLIWTAGPPTSIPSC